jgi:transposase
MKADGLEPLLTNSRFILLKRPENLTDKQDMKLAELVQYNLRSIRAYLLKEDFQQFWEYVSPYYAGKFLDTWCTRTMRSKIEPMKKMAKTLRNHHPLLMNWFKAKGELSSGVVEGFLTVGTPVTGRPPHRPGRAVFPHPVPRLYSLSRRTDSKQESRALVVFS